MILLHLMALFKILNMKKYILSIVIFHIWISVFSNTNFSDLVSQLENSVKDVELKNSNTYQKITEKEPGIILYQKENIDSKGKSTKIIYQINLSDIDKYTVREFTSKDRIEVHFAVEQNQKFISVIRNDIIEPYVSEIDILAINIDNAKEIKSILLKLIPTSKEIYSKRINLNSFNEKIDFLKKNIQQDKTPSLDIKQDIYISADTDDFLIKQSSLSGSKSNDLSYKMNLANVDLNYIKAIVKGEKVFVFLQTKNKQKIIQEIKNEVSQPYKSELLLEMKDVDQARDIIKVLKDVIPKMENIVKKNMPKGNTVELLIQNLNTTISGDNENFSRSFVVDCLTEFQYVKEKKAKEPINYTYRFNFSDINEHSVNYVTKGREIGITFSTIDNEKLIRVEKNSLQQNFHKEILFSCNNFSEARMVKYLIEKTIKKCTEEHNQRKSVFNEKENIDYLSKNISNINYESKNIEQVFGKVDGNDNIFQLKTTTISKSKISEILREFNLSYFSEQSINYKISGKILSIKLDTDYKSKVIKVYKEGKVDNYQSDFQIFFKDVETAKQCIVKFKALIKHYKLDESR